MWSDVSAVQQFEVPDSQFPKMPTDKPKKKKLLPLTLHIDGLI
jgi:hypothetical protein